MSENNENKIKDQVQKEYLETVQRRTDAVQASGDIPEMFTFTHNDRQWVLTLPRSVMAQKRLLHIQGEYFAKQTYEAEEEMLKLFAQNATVDGRPVSLNSLTMGEIEVLKLAYMDGLLLPLFLGGENEVQKYKQAAVLNLR